MSMRQLSVSVISLPFCKPKPGWLSAEGHAAVMDDPVTQTVRERADHRCDKTAAFRKTRSHSSSITSNTSSLARNGGKGRQRETRSGLMTASAMYNKIPNLRGLDPESGVLVRLFNPRLDKWDEHFERNGVLIVGLTAVGRATGPPIEDECCGSATGFGRESLFLRDGKIRGKFSCPFQPKCV